jgi:hypothetical protein
MEQSLSSPSSPIIQNDTIVEVTLTDHHHQQQDRISHVSIDPLNKTASLVLQHLLDLRKITMFIVFSLVVYIYTWLYVGCVWNPAGHINNVQVTLLNSEQGFNLSDTLDSLQNMIVQSTGGRSLGEILAEKLATVPEANLD